MIRRIPGACEAFVLDTPATTYAFRVAPTGHLEHLYYGRRLTLASERDLEPLAEKRAYAPGNMIRYSPEHPTAALEDMSLELSAPGRGDVREPFIELVHTDGGRTSDFLFRRAEISDDKPPYETLPGSYAGDGGAEHLTVELEDRQYDLTLELHYYVYGDCDCICRSARLINHSEHTVQIERLLSLQLDLPGAGWAVSSFHGAWLREMERHTVTLTGGRFVAESCAGVSSNRTNPFFMLHAPETTETAGDCLGFNLLYSGSHYASVGVGAAGKTRVVSGVNPRGFRYLLDPGGSFEAPEAVMTFSDGGFDGMSQRMHRFVREHIVRDQWKHRPRPVLLNSWEACYFGVSESSLLALARAGRDLGIELFVLDDGWFMGRTDDTRALGDWEPDRKKLPGGLDGLARKLGELGLGFGLWVEPEMVSVNSRMYEAHPDWAMAIPGKPHSEGRNQRVLDLANPAVADFVIEKMTEVFSSADIAYVKWDMNRIFSDVYSPYLPPERQGETAHRYVCGLYRVLRTLTERFPHILFEGCASGGNRFDLGMLCYFPQIWASDNTDAVCRARIQEGYSFGYPMSTVAAHVSACPNHQTLRDTPLDTRFSVAAFGVLGYELDLRDLSAPEKKRIREQIALYKTWREVLQFGRFHRGRTGNLHEWTCVSGDGGQAVGLLMQELARPNRPSERFFAAGLNEDRVYRFYNIPAGVNVKRFGSLVNTVAPFHIRQDSLVHNVLALAMQMPGEREDCTAPGRTLMRAGVSLRQAYTGVGYDENVRYFQDFSSRLYFLLAEE